MRSSDRGGQWHGDCRPYEHGLKDPEFIRRRSHCMGDYQSNGMACSQAVLLTTPRNLNFRKTTAQGKDLNKKKFQVALKHVDDVTDNTKEGDVTVSCPPENPDGYFIVAFNDLIRVKRGPGFPECDKEKAPKVELDKKKKEIRIILYKAVPGAWEPTWRELALL